MAAQEPGPIYFCGSDDASAEAAIERFGAGLRSFAEEMQTASANGKDSARHSAALSHRDVGAIRIRDSRRAVRLIIVWKAAAARCLFRSVARKGNGLLFTGRQGASSMQENPYYAPRRANRLARHLQMRDAAP